jgi:hypothetical protein
LIYKKETFFDFKIIYITRKAIIMGRIKNYQQFNESFTITLDQLPSIGDIVDRIDWKEGQKIAFIDFKGIKNIPVNIANNSETDTLETDKSSTNA